VLRILYSIYNDFFNQVFANNLLGIGDSFWDKATSQWVNVQ